MVNDTFCLEDSWLLVAFDDAFLATSDAFLLGDLLGDSVALSGDAFLFKVDDTFSLVDSVAFKLYLVLLGDLVAVFVALLFIDLAAVDAF